jgi:hypothetical protein
MTGSCHRAGSLLAFLLLGLISVRPLPAQLVVKLSPETVSAFEAYASKVEKDLTERWEGKKNFLSIDDDPQARQQVLNGQVFIKQMNNGQPVEINSGLIHDWLGTVFIPKTDIPYVVNLLEDFDRHSDVYPAVGKSHLIKRSGNDVTGYWRLQQKGMVPVTLDVESEVRYSELAPGKWKGVSYAKKIIEIDSGLFGGGKKFALGEGHGYLWRLYGYWTLQAVNGGVLAECRTLSLTRDIPQGLAWAVGPYVEKMPQQSLTSTLKETRDAIEKQGK